MITAAWLKTLRLEHRKSPEFIRPHDNLNGVPHGALIRQSFEELGLAAIHCISGVPSIAFLVQENFNQDEVDYAHKALWNQGLASLLLVITDDTLKAYSLAQIPSANQSVSEKLIVVLNLINNALELKDLVLGVESGRFIAEYEEKFNANYRIDQVLLGNLETTVEKLVTNNMTLEAAQALLMQIMFIAYLEDKEIINTLYFQQATGVTKIDSLKSLLYDGRPAKFYKLFKLLKEHFNGDLFVAPCSFDSKETVDELNESHIKILSEFRAGNINLHSGQYQFWPYDFKFIPIDLISAVYDRFLGFDPISKRESGAYYTPMFLADLVTEQAWCELTGKQKTQGTYVDPSCGSGIFLVRLLEKMIDDWKSNHNDQRPTWPALLSMLRRLHGFDIKKESIRVAAFSLYIALLENTRPAEILALMQKGRLLPKLFGETLQVCDFFEVSTDEYQYDLVIGNPPWVSRRGNQKSAEKWCKENKCEMPAKEIAWGFAWKAPAHAKQNGVIALLLKATSFLTSQSSTFNVARKQWMNTIELIRIINFADTRFQLFEGGDAPTALMIYKNKDREISEYSFDYWSPKADLNLRTKRLMTLSNKDKAKLPIQLAIEDQLLMKRRMWMQTPDAKLFQYFNQMPKLAEKLVTFQDSQKENRKKINGGLSNKWTIGQGFKRAQADKIGAPNYSTSKSTIIKKIPFLDMDFFHPLVMPTVPKNIWPTDIVHRVGFENGFKSPHILIPQGIERHEGRLRASYCEQDICFLSSLQAIYIHDGDTETAKFLTLLLNSSLVAWYLFHSSSVTGMERDKVPQQELLEIPFPLENGDAEAFRSGVDLINHLLQTKDNLLRLEMSDYMQDIDDIVYRYFGLEKADILIIEDTLKYIIPSMQPRSKTKTLPILWKDTVLKDWKNYSKWLTTGLDKWLEAPTRSFVELIGFSSDLVILGVHLSDKKGIKFFEQNLIDDIDSLLSKIWMRLPENISGNFQLIPDLRIFIDDVLYIVKPRKMRFWFGTTALADADAIASDLLAQAK